MTTEISNPFPQFHNLRGDLLDGGFVYIGTAGADPELSPIATFWDDALTIPAAQPLRTRGGYIVNGSSPARVYTSPGDYSIRTRDSDGSVVFSAPNTLVAGVASQPLDSDLTAIAALSTTPFGRALLTVANAAGLRSMAEIPATLPLTGGTVTGNIVRSGGGAHWYWADAAATSGRVFKTDAGAADPTSLEGDVWLEKKA